MINIFNNRFESFLLLVFFDKEFKITNWFELYSQKRKKFDSPFLYHWFDIIQNLIQTIHEKLSIE